MDLIYLIDDNEGFNVLTSKVIERLETEFEIVKFSDPDEALDNLLALDKLPKFIFLDINMPRLDGWELLNMLEEERPDDMPETNVIMLTTSILPADMEKSDANFNVKHYINKPLSEFHAQKILIDDQL